MRNFIDIVENAKTFSPAFQSWFGNSKAVDASGNPLMLFHGTGESFTSFKATRMIWASADAKLANDYAQMRQEWHGGNATVMPLYMSIQHPFDAEKLPNAVTVQQFFAAMIDQAQTPATPEIEDLQDIVIQGRYREESGPHYDRHDFWLDAASLFGMDGRTALQKAFTLLGFDGVMMLEDGNLTYGVFDPRKVKSAIGNSGQYSDSDDITEARLKWGHGNAGCWITDLGKILPCDYEADTHHVNVAYDHFAHDLPDDTDPDDWDEVSPVAFEHGWVRIRMTYREFLVNLDPKTVTARALNKIPALADRDGHERYAYDDNSQTGMKSFESMGQMMAAIRDKVSAL